MLPLPFVADGAVTNKIKGDNMDIINGYITDDNIVRQNEDAYGNILTLNYSRNKYEIHFVECYRKNIDEYESKKESGDTTTFDYLSLRNPDELLKEQSDIIKDIEAYLESKEK